MDRALPSEWRRLDTDDHENLRSARYSATGDPAGLAARVRLALAAQGFALFPSSGLPDPSLAEPPVMLNQTPATVALAIAPTEPLPVDVVHVGDFRGTAHFGTSRSVSFYPGVKPGSTVVEVKANAEG